MTADERRVVEEHLDKEYEGHQLIQRYEPWQAADLTAAHLRPPPWIIPQLLRERSLNIITGETYTGKSLFALSLAVTIDTGVNLLGHHVYTPKPGHRVLFFGQDAPTWDYAEQYLKLWRGAGVPLHERNPRSLFFLNRGANLMDPGFWDTLVKFNDVLGCDILILDTLLEFHSKNENDNHEMKEVMGQLKRIRDTLGMAIIYIHHEAKGNGNMPVGANKKARGAGLIVQSSDFHINLSVKRKGLIALNLPKARGADDEVEPPEQFEITRVPHPDGKALRLIATTPDKTRVNHVLQFLSEERTRKDVIEHLVNTETLLDIEDATKHADRILEYLIHHKKIARVRFGVYKRIQ